ncbi:hypothetical protein [Luedemannella helvata]
MTAKPGRVTLAVAGMWNVPPTASGNQPVLMAYRISVRTVAALGWG